MKYSRAHIPTLRDAPQEAEVTSHKLMMRAGMIRRLASGIYSFLPFGWRSVMKLSTIIREELNRVGAEEVSLPVIQPKEIWEESGRWALYGKELGRFKDRHENEFCLQPTSEEAITDLLRRDLKSYRQLPITLYQIQTKFRDEIRPRFGIMRGREFLMKDAYSFDLDEKGAFENYEMMRKAYRRIFLRTGLHFKAVDADTGAIGGSRSEEFSVLADSGEDELVACESCDYGANQEKAESRLPHPSAGDGALEKFATPNLRTIEDLAKSLKVESSSLLKTMIAKDDDGKCIVVLLRGDHELHELKLQNLLKKAKGLKNVRLARDEELKEWKLPKGSLGPAKFPRDAIIVVDQGISLTSAYVTGANEEGFHFKNMVLSRDARADVQGSIHHIRANEPCPKCAKPLKVLRSIEVGHVFYLGKKYSEAMKLTVTTESGQSQLVEMGCYGIGVGRTVAACIEQNHDKDGICWPVSLAPFELAIVSLGEGEPHKEAERLYHDLQKQNVDVLWDDRPLSPGVKLKDIDLIGIPYQIIIGEKGLQKGELEWKIRKGQKKEFIKKSDILPHAIRALQEEKAKILQVAQEVQ